MKRFFLLFMFAGIFGYTKAQCPQEFSAAIQVSLVTLDIQEMKNMVIWQKIDPALLTPSGITIDHFNIYRQDSAHLPYAKLGEVPFADPSFFMDVTSEPQLQSYKYKITAAYNVTPPGTDCITDIDSCNFHKTLYIENITVGDTFKAEIEPYQVEDTDISNFLDTVAVYIYRSPDPLTILDIANIIDTIYYNPLDSIFSYYDDDSTAMDTLNYYIGVAELPDSIDIDEFTGMKASSGPYSQSLSNLEDNGIIGTRRPKTAVFSDALRIYPNPFTDQTTIRFDNPGRKNYTLYLRDITGKTIYRRGDIQNGTVTLLNEGWNKGFYLVEIRGDKIFRGRIILQ